MELTPTIGLEIHVEMKTKTKMFCGCLNDSDEKHPNINVCPICMGYPGVLPVINKEAVKNVLKTGMALNGELADFSRFDRKNYFYPDLPKGYQISQYKHPLVEGGYLEIPNSKIRIRRIHLEEDAGRLIHEGDSHGRIRIAEDQGSEARYSYADFNRAGIPLMELVTEPDITSGKDSRVFSEELQLVLRYLGVSDADMEKGEMRCEVNISLNMGTKVEIKNLNSFRAVEKVIDYEIERQTGILEQGGRVEQETRGWDENKQKTFSQRKKEEVHDYRYFPEPDLPPLKVSSFSPRFAGEAGKFQVSSLPELPQQKRKRFKQEFALKDEQIEILVRDKQLSDFFEKTMSELKAEAGVSPSPELAFNYLSSDLVGLMNEKYLTWEDLRVSPHSFGELMALVSENKISSAVAKNVLKIMTETGKDAGVIVQEQELEQTSDEGFIEEVMKKIIAENSKAVSDYKNGKEEALQFLIGQAMRETKGRANPEILRKGLTRFL